MNASDRVLRDVHTTIRNQMKAARQGFIRQCGAVSAAPTPERIRDFAQKQRLGADALDKLADKLESTLEASGRIVSTELRA